MRTNSWTDSMERKRLKTPEQKGGFDGEEDGEVEAEDGQRNYLTIFFTLPPLKKIYSIWGTWTFLNPARKICQLFRKISLRPRG